MLSDPAAFFLLYFHINQLDNHLALNRDRGLSPIRQRCIEFVVIEKSTYARRRTSTPGTCWFLLPFTLHFTGLDIFTSSSHHLRLIFASSSHLISLFVDLLSSSSHNASIYRPRRVHPARYRTCTSPRLPSVFLCPPLTTLPT